MNKRLIQSFNSRTYQKDLKKINSRIFSLNIKKNISKNKIN
jgi:hypothetical protein